MVLPALNLSNMNAGILIMMQQVRLMMFSLNTVDYSMSFLLLSTQNFFCWTSRGDHSEPFLLFEFYCGTPSSCLKVRGGVCKRLCGVVQAAMWCCASGYVVVCKRLCGGGP